MIKLRLLIPLPFLLTVAACGSFADGEHSQMEAAVAAAITTQTENAAPMVVVRSVGCVGQRPSVQCTVHLGVGNTVVSLRYTVAIGTDNCWSATARNLRVDGSESQTNPIVELSPASDLKGCLA